MMANANAWIRGRQATLVANPKWWAGKTKLAKLVYRFYPDSQTEAQQIKSGELDVFNPQPQVFLVPLRKQAGLKTQVGMGPTFEYIGFNTGFISLSRFSARPGSGRRSRMRSTGRRW